MTVAREYLDALAALAQRVDDVGANLAELARLGASDRRVDEVEHALAAKLAEVEGRLDRALARLRTVETDIGHLERSAR